MLKIEYSPLILARMREVCDEAERLHATIAARDFYCQEKVGLTYRYMNRAGKDFASPSARVILNMGLEVWIKDPVTGQMEIARLTQPCDWNPRNPRMRASSSTGSGT